MKEPPDFACDERFWSTSPRSRAVYWTLAREGKLKGLDELRLRTTSLSARWPWARRTVGRWSCSASGTGMGAGVEMARDVLVGEMVGRESVR
jgi:hypothetical protein